MTQSTISTNGHSTNGHGTNGHGTNGHGTNGRTATAPPPLIGSERRQSAATETVSPEELIERHVDSARRQLADARENLKAARRRVVQLEDALCNWERFAAELRRAHGTRNA